MTPRLPAIAAMVRSGAVERAWTLFEAGGYAGRTGDPAALAVKGRLLKARGRQAQGAARRRLMSSAAQAYGAAHTLSPAPYLAINAATLTLLAGQPSQAAEQARAVLALLDGPKPLADTRYFLAATRAEAHLLLGERDAAERALSRAVLHDRDGWDDRAATLAQLREILAEQDRDAAWLAPFDPPASLHFAGHMGFAAGGRSEALLREGLAPLLAELRPGFAWGALAAGADLVIAEHLLAAGCEVHAELPCPEAQFAEQSVAPAGSEWLARFRTVLAACASVRVASAAATSVHDPLATERAGELAIGGAAINAARLGTRLTQLIVLDEQGGGSNTARQAELWRPDLGAQHRLTIPRDAEVEVLFPPELPDPARQLALLATIGCENLLAADSPDTANIAALTEPIAAALAGLPSHAVRAAPGLWELVVTDVDLGLRTIAGVLESCARANAPPPAIGAHLAICPVLHDTASGSAIAYGPEPRIARRLMQLAPAGVILASDPLAVTLAARGDGPLRSELYLPDEPDLGGAAHLLLPAIQ